MEGLRRSWDEHQKKATRCHKHMYTLKGGLWSNPLGLGFGLKIHVQMNLLKGKPTLSVSLRAFNAYEKRSKQEKSQKKEMTKGTEEIKKRKSMQWGHRNPWLLKGKHRRKGDIQHHSYSVEEQKAAD